MLLEAEQLGKQFRTRSLFQVRTHWAFRNVDLCLAAGEGLAIVGPSGAGKSTLLRCLAALDTPSRGRVLWDGAPASERSATLLDRARVQLVMQDSAMSFAPWMTVQDLYGEPLRIHQATMPADAWQLLRAFGIVEEAWKRLAMELSGGERQRLALARALLLRPEVLLLDECFSGLDRPTQAMLLEALFEQQRERGLAWIIVTHDLTLARHMADEVIVLNAGEIVARGASSELCPY